MERALLARACWSTEAVAAPARLVNSEARRPCRSTSLHCFCPSAAGLGEGQRVPVERVGLCAGRSRRAPGGVAVGAGVRLPVGLAVVVHAPLCTDICTCCGWCGSTTARVTRRTRCAWAARHGNTTARGTRVHVSSRICERAPTCVHVGRGSTAA